MLTVVPTIVSDELPVSVCPDGQLAVSDSGLFWQLANSVPDTVGPPVGVALMVTANPRGFELQPAPSEQTAEMLYVPATVAVTDKIPALMTPGPLVTIAVVPVGQLMEV